MGDRAYKLKTRYGLRESVYNDILRGQEYRCKICGEPHTEEDKLHVDHEELVNGKIVCRGLLCNLCNGALAFARHDPKILRASAEYLENR